VPKFFARRHLRVAVALRLPPIPAAQSVPRAPAKPSGLRVRVRCNRQGLPPDRPGSAKPCGRRQGSSMCLTALASPVQSANDSGGSLRELSCGRQTGNSGVNPGRPRRCDQATRSAASGHCGVRERRAFPREGMRPTKSGSQKTYQVSWVRRTARAGRRTRSLATVRVFDSSPQERDAVRPRGRLRAERAPGCRSPWPYHFTRAAPVEA
jgi:hypothetical protein